MADDTPDPLEARRLDVLAAMGEPPAGGPVGPWTIVGVIDTPSGIYYQLNDGATTVKERKRVAGRPYVCLNSKCMARGRRANHCRHVQFIWDHDPEALAAIVARHQQANQTIPRGERPG